MAAVSHPVFARVYERLSVMMDRAGGAEHRHGLVAGLHGRVIEVGAGNGRTFAHYPPQVTEVVAVEPEPRLRAAALAAALAEIARVLRTGGQLRFFEHVAADTPGAMRRAQRVADATVWPRLFGGCRTGRDTIAAITVAGFVVEELHRFRFSSTGPASPAAPHVRGCATRPATRSGDAAAGR
jgi:hypothetical protein